MPCLPRNNKSLPRAVRFVIVTRSISCVLSVHFGWKFNVNDGEDNKVSLGLVLYEEKERREADCAHWKNEKNCPYNALVDR